MTQITSTGLRILVAAGSSADAAQAMRLITGLPEAFCAALGGVFVEEPHILETSRFPARRMVTRSGVTMLAPDLGQVRTVLRAEARAFRKALDHANRNAATQTPFLRQQGELISTAVRAAQGWDVLVIGCRPLHRVPGQIVMLGGAAGPSAQVRDVAHSLSRRFSTTCLSFVIGAGATPDTPPPADRAYGFETLDAAIRALARTNALAVLTDLSSAPIPSQSDLARILEASRCPLVVIGASQATAGLEHSVHIPTPDPDQGQADAP